MTTIALINQKGGVGKTTSTFNIGVGLAMKKKKVLLIDLDPQSHLTYSAGIAAHNLTLTAYDVLKRSATISDVAIDIHGITLVPSSLELSRAELELAREAGREFLLREALSYEDFDYVLLDCPPSLGVLTLNALTAAQEVYIPVQTEFLSLQGMSHLIETINIVKGRLNNALEITGIIGTRFDKRKTLNKEIIDKIRSYFGDKIFKTLIRDNISLAEAPSYGKPIFAYKPESYGAEDYLQLTKEILKRRKNVKTTKNGG